MAECRSCGARIVWGKTTAGKLIPLDAEPAADGNVVNASQPGLVRFLRKEEMGSPLVVKRWKSHFSTCPNAVIHRKKAKAK